MARSARSQRRKRGWQRSPRGVLALFAAAAPSLWLAAANAEQIAPMAWDDPILGTSLAPINGDTNLPGGSTFAYTECDDPFVFFACVIMNWPPGPGLATLSNIQIRSNEGIRRRGGLNTSALIEWAYIEVSGIPGGHADGIQFEGGYSPTLIRNTYIKMNYTPGRTAGLFAADGTTGHLQLQNVIFDGGPRGMVIACDGATSVGLDRIYFVNGTFDTAGFHINAGMQTEPACNGTGWTLTQWDEVWNADIVNGVLVPTDAIPPPCSVPCIPPVLQGGGGPTADFDGDGVPNPEDFCSLDPDHPGEFNDCDSDQDGFGNGCDADLNNDLAVDGFDLAPFVTDLAVGTDSGWGTDFNCDGIVDGFDIAPLIDLIEETTEPGPSGLECAGEVPCP
jgi:hypothetical protein